MAQPVNGAPQLLKGLNIAFIGMFEPYSQLNLISMCKMLGANHAIQVTKSTSVLIQGTHIAGFYGNPHWYPHMNTINQIKSATNNGVRIVPYDQIDDYFIQKTGKTVEELMKINKNLSSSPKSNQNLIQQNISKFQVRQKSEPQLQSIHKNKVKKTSQSIKISHLSTDKQDFKETVIKALHLAGFKSTLEISQYKEFLEMLATVYFTGELTFDGIIEYLEDIFQSDTQKRRFIAETMQMIKKDFHKEKQEEQSTQRDVRNDKNILNQNINSSSDAEKNVVEIKYFKSKILSSFEVLKKDCNKTKGVCYQSFNDIFDSIKELQNSNDVNAIKQTVNQLKKDVQRCFFIYRMLGKSLRNYERELRPLIQEEHEIPDTESVSSCLSRKNVYDVDKERPSKKERLAMKKQQKKMEKHQIQAPQQKTQPKVDINVTEKHLNEEDRNEFDDYGFAHLPALLYLRRNFTEDQIPERYKKLPSNRYSLSIKGKTDFSMREFLRYDWRDLQRLVIKQCQLVSQDWDLLCNHSQLLFKNLKVLSLGSNKIEEVRKEEILRFPQLQGLNLGKNPLHTNPLSRQSVEDLRRWQIESKFDGKIIFYQKQDK